MWRKDELYKCECRRASDSADTCIVIAQTCTSLASILAHCRFFFLFSKNYNSFYVQKQKRGVQVKHLS